jgi:hypothetical protein
MTPGLARGSDSRGHFWGNQLWGQHRPTTTSPQWSPQQIPDSAPADYGTVQTRTKVGTGDGELSHTYIDYAHHGALVAASLHATLPLMHTPVVRGRLFRGLGIEIG